MKKLLAVIGFLLPVAVFAGSITITQNAGDITMVSGVPAVSTAMAVEFSTGVSVVGSINTASATVTTTANTKLLVVPFTWRNSSTQTPTVSWQGSQITISTYTVLPAIGAGIAYILNPGAVSGGTLNLSLSAVSGGLGIAGVGITNVTQTPYNPFTKSDDLTTAVTSSSTVTTAVGDLNFSLMSPQDTTQSQPVVGATSSPTRVLSYLWGSAGNGGWFDVLVATATTSPTVVNESWTGGGRRYSEVGIAIRQ